MQQTAVLASALVRPALVLTTEVPGAYGGGGGDGGDGGRGGGGGGCDGGRGGDGGDGGGDGGDGGGAGQVEIVPATRVRVVSQEQTVPPLGLWTLEALL